LGDKQHQHEPYKRRPADDRRHRCPTRPASKHALILAQRRWLSVGLGQKSRGISGQLAAVALDADPKLIHVSNRLRSELALAFGASALVVGIVLQPNCLLACGMFAPPEPTVTEWAALGLLAAGWAWIALLVRAARRQN
jgi:hypothetical protein